MEITLNCGCRITKDGKFYLGVACAECRECILISQIHPFTDKRLEQ